jgi:hypothetical protein
MLSRTSSSSWKIRLRTRRSERDSKTYHIRRVGERYNRGSSWAEEARRKRARIAGATEQGGETGWKHNKEYGDVEQDGGQQIGKEKRAKGIRSMAASSSRFRHGRRGPIEGP